MNDVTLSNANLSEIIVSSFYNITKDSQNPHTIYIFGPPCVGKTHIQKEVFNLLNSKKICFFRSSCYLKDRKKRLENSIGECSPLSHDLTKLRRIFLDIMAGNSVYIPKYEHQTGTRSNSKYNELHVNEIIYLEGVIWFYLMDICQPDCMVFLFPENLEQWNDAYKYRNIKYRNYSVSLADKMCKLLNISWDELNKNQLDAFFRQHNNVMKVGVTFGGENYDPIYKIYQS